ncbi:MAG: type II secretion system F family protein [Microbacteriaceae bacterium]
MSIILGCILGVGLLLIAAPMLWPRQAGERLQRAAHTGRLRERLAAAGYPGVSPLAFTVVSVLVAVCVAALVQAIVAVVVLSAVAGGLGLLVPNAFVSWRVTIRRQAHRTVWPDVVDHLVSAVRSGLALPDGVSALAHNGPVSTRPAFAEFERDYRSTGNFSGCVDRLKARLADPVADRILETLRMAREVGGSDLTVVLRSLTGYLREESAIRSEVQARQSWVMNAAKLGVAAPWVVLFLLASRPEAAVAYNTAAGTTVIVVGLLVSLIAYRIMLFIGRLPEEKRWFR